MCLPTDAASRVFTCDTGGMMVFIVFLEHLDVFVFPANVTFALSLFACAGILPESFLAVGLRAIPEGAEPAATILLYWGL